MKHKKITITLTILTLIGLLILGAIETLATTPLFSGQLVDSQGNYLPLECESWFDGCNNCIVSEGLLSCTKKFCENYEEPECLKYKKSDCICTMEYNPVCGINGETYDNPCVANCENIEIDYYGECQEQTVCAMDMKQCDDGTWVGRTGPNCEFECPEIEKQNILTRIKLWLRRLFR